MHIGKCSPTTSGQSEVEFLMCFTFTSSIDTHFHFHSASHLHLVLIRVKRLKTLHLFISPFHSFLLSSHNQIYKLFPIQTTETTHTQSHVSVSVYHHHLHRANLLTLPVYHHESRTVRFWTRFQPASRSTSINAWWSWKEPHGIRSTL